MDNTRNTKEDSQKKMKLMQNQKTGSAKIRSKFEYLRREIKADIRKQHDFYVNILVGDFNADPRDFSSYINSQKKDTQGTPFKKEGWNPGNGSGVA